MSIRIGHASISEYGTSNGTKGDSTGKEVCTRAWYSKPWDFMAIHPDEAVREAHASAVEAACANENIGYGQNDRNTANTEAKKVDYILSKIKTKCNCDCSSLQNLCAVASRAPGVTYGSNGWTTSTMKAALKNAGYKIITDSTYLASEKYCIRGAIYVKESSHTVSGLDNGSSYKNTLEKAGLSSGSASGSGASTTFQSTIKEFQNYLNTAYQSTIKKYCGALLNTDNSYGTKSRAAALCAWKYEMNKLKVGYVFDLSNANFGDTCKKYGNKAIVKSRSRGAFAYIAQGILRAKGYYTGKLDGDSGTLTVAAIKAYQSAKGLSADGECGANTWHSLFN